MRSFSSTDQHPAFPDEKGKLNTKTKLLLNTTRDVVLAILEGKTSLMLQVGKLDGGFQKASHDISSHYLPITQDERSIDRTKTTIHQALMMVGISRNNTKKRISTSVRALASQYENMSNERFLHRLQNGKVYRDTKFLIILPHLVASEGNQGRKSTLENLASKHFFQNLERNSEANAALKKLLHKAKSVFQDTYGKREGKDCYNSFIKEIEKQIDAYIPNRE